MNTPDPVNKNSLITFNEKHSLAIRIWHWVTFATLTSTLVLVLLGSTMFRTKNNIGLVQEQLEGKGVTVTRDQARSVAHEYSDKIWMAHKFVGYGLCFLLLCRLVIEAAQPGDEKITTRLKRAFAFKAGTEVERGDRRLYTWVKSGYVIFYVLFLVMALTGLVLAFEDVPMLDGIHDSMKKVHETVQYFIYAYVFLHLTGVVVADVGRYGGIVSGMIHKKK